MSRRTLIATGFLALLPAVGCTRGDAELAQIFDSRTPRPAGSETTLRQRPRRLAGENPLGLPSRALAAAPGDFVLAPSFSTLEQAFEQGVEGQAFVYYGAVIDELGPLETSVRYLTHERRTVPNALLVPIRRGGLASAGDVVLTSRASGAGLSRALAVGGEPSTPRVKYLDPALRDPRPAGPMEDTLPRNSFHVLREPGEPGSTLACTTEARVEPVILLKRIDQLRLVLGFAGRLQVFAEAACRSLPIAVDLRPEQKVRFPLLAGFAEGRVESLDTPNGRVWVRFERAGETQRIGIGLGNLESLEPSAAPAGGER